MDRVPPRRFLVALALLTAAFVVGASLPRDPDFDVTFGIEAWRRFGPIACAQAVTAAFVGGARSELPISAWRAGHWSAFGPVPRWSIRTSR